MAGGAYATPVVIDLAGAPGSSVTLSNVSTWPSGWTGLTPNLAPDLDSQYFELVDGAWAVFEFFTLTADGLGLGSANVSATLAFDVPFGLGGSGSGDVHWGTFFGIVSGGTLTWTSMPVDVTLADGNVLRIAFEEGVAVELCDTATVHATVTNLGGASVPDGGATAMLLGGGLMALAALRRRFRA